MALEPRQQRFVQAYLRTLNATKAALEAGYSPQTAYSQGSRLLKKVEISEAIVKAHERTLNRYEVNRERIIAEQARVAFANMEDYTRRTDDGELLLDFSALSRDQAAAISEITTETEIVVGETGEPKKRGRKAEAAPAAPRIVVRKTKLKLHDKLRALELLGRPFGLSNVHVKMTIDDARPDLSDLGEEELALLREAARLLAAPTIEGTAEDVSDDPDNSPEEE